MTAGWIFCIGMQNWKRDRHLPYIAGYAGARAVDAGGFAGRAASGSTNFGKRVSRWQCFNRCAGGGQWGGRGRAGTGGYQLSPDPEVITVRWGQEARLSLPHRSTPFLIAAGEC